MFFKIIMWISHNKKLMMAFRTVSAATSGQFNAKIYRIFYISKNTYSGVIDVCSKNKSLFVKLFWQQQLVL